MNTKKPKEDQMSEYISIRNDLYQKLDNMRTEKENGKKKSFSDVIDLLFDAREKLSTFKRELGT
jgi:predicted CopG family antitoxin